MNGYTSTKAAKKYKYGFKKLNSNNGIVFLKEQLGEFNKFNIDLLSKYINYIDSSSDLNEFMSNLVIKDIKKFILEIENAKNSLYKEYNGLSKGAFGENKAKDVIYTYEDEWNILSNARLNIEGNKIENDFILIDETGVSTIEVKNIGGYTDTLKIDSLGRAFLLNKFKKEINSYDIIHQANRHQAYLKRFLNKNLNYTGPISSYIVIASKVKIKNESEFNVIGINRIYPTIKANKKVLNSEEINNIHSLILNNLIDSTSYSYTDYISTLEENYRLILMSIKEVINNK